MATYVIGDVHGCLETLHRLLELFHYDGTRDRILMTGDLVNGGPESAGVVRWAMENQASVVLGNHDLHLLAVAAGVRRLRKKDTFTDLLGASDGDELLNWLRTRPLVIQVEDVLLVHAGLLPDWDVETALQLGREVEAILQGKSAGRFLDTMYGDKPRRWNDQLEGRKRLRVIVNAMTRMRMLTGENEIDLKHKKPPKSASSELRPWFSVPGRRSSGTRIFFGHWAALGFYVSDNVVGLDSGCAWNGKLTAWRLDDGKTFQVRSELRRKIEA